MQTLSPIPDGLASNAGDARPNVRDLLLEHRKALVALREVAASADDAGTGATSRRVYSDRAYIGRGESWVVEWLVAFDGLPQTVTCQLAAEFEGDGELIVRFGGSRGRSDGETVLSCQPSSASPSWSAQIANPGGTVRVKLISNGAEARIFFPSILFS